MFNWKLFLFFALIFGAAAHSQENPNNPFTFKWDNGFQLQSQDSIFSLNFGGYILVDHAYFFDNAELSYNFGPLKSKSGTEIRSARLSFGGNIYENTNFKFQMDLAGDKVTLTDVYIGISNIPGIGNFRVGHFNEPFRFSALSSSTNLTFMERGANSYFSQLRNNGAMIFNDFIDKQLSVQLGAFRNANNDSNDAFANDGYVLAGRVTGIPIRNNSKRQLLHVGASYNYRKPDNRQYNISISPESHLAEKYLKTGTIELVEDVHLANLETVYIQGPFSIQAEYLHASVNAVDYQYHFSNYYAELSYFITGESKNYKGSYEGLGRVKPRNNFGGREKGFGALEIAFRYSNTDLTDGIIEAGIESDIAVGLNWYLNPVTRVMFNYGKVLIKDKGNLDVLQARFQIDF